MTEIIKRIKAYFDPHVETTMEDWRPCEKHITIETLKKGNIIKRSGDCEEYLRFVLKGGGILFLKKEDGKDCVEVVLENEFLSDFHSLFSGKPSDYFVECLKPLKLAVIRREHLLESYDKSLTAANLGRILAEQQHRKTEMLYSLNRGVTTERYKLLLMSRGELLQHVGQELLASLIGISIQSFRRARSFFKPVKGLLKAWF